MKTPMKTVISTKLYSNVIVITPPDVCLIARLVRKTSDRIFLIYPFNKSDLGK